MDQVSDMGANVSAVFNKDSTGNAFSVVILLNWKDEDGFPNFAFFEITAKNLNSFCQATRAGIVNLENFGRVIRHGYGYPSSEATKDVAENYKIESEKIKCMQVCRPAVNNF